MSCKQATADHAAEEKHREMVNKISALSEALDRTKLDLQSAEASRMERMITAESGAEQARLALTRTPLVPATRPAAQQNATPPVVVPVLLEKKRVNERDRLAVAMAEADGFAFTLTWYKDTHMHFVYSSDSERTRVDVSGDEWVVSTGDGGRAVGTITRAMGTLVDYAVAKSLEKEGPPTIVANERGYGKSEAFLPMAVAQDFRDFVYDVCADACKIPPYIFDTVWGTKLVGTFSGSRERLAQSLQNKRFLVTVNVSRVENAGTHLAVFYITHDPRTGALLTAIKNRDQGTGKAEYTGGRTLLKVIEELEKNVLRIEINNATNFEGVVDFETLNTYEPVYITASNYQGSEKSEYAVDNLFYEFIQSVRAPPVLRAALSEHEAERVRREELEADQNCSDDDYC